MENVVKQGFLKLKKGNPNDGRVLSGILEKMTPRKWYVLIVRNRVPFLEQYDRDVDVFSGAPCVAYNLSACSSICRTMSTTARTFSFYIVCPDDMVELIAASREQMVDWCNTLEHTLGSLGILKREKEEHIYTVCPAVVNFVGRSQLKTSEDEDDPSHDYEDELGAVGGTPAPPTTPPPRSQVPPIPTSHHPPLPRMLSEPASYRSSPSPPSLRPVRNFPRGRSSSPSEFQSCGSQTSSVTPRSPSPPPVPAVVSTKQEKGLPPVPLPMSVTASSGCRKQPAGACDSEEEESDSSDFVSGAFWEINRKTPIPSARHAVWPPKSSVPNPSSSSSSAAPSVGSGVASLGAGAGDESFEDEGYTDLSTVSTGRRPEPPEQPDDDDKNDKKYEYAKVKKKPAAAVGAIRCTDNSEGTESSVNENPSSSPCVESSNTGETSVETSATDAVCSPAQSENDLVTDGGTENFYAPFPVESEDSSMESSRHSEDCDYDDMGVGVSMVKIISSPAHRNRSPGELPQTPEEDVVEDCMYASACEASSLFPSDSGPPLPPRQDSLSAWKLDGESTNHAGAENASQTSTPTESPTRRPIPRRRTLHSSHPVTRAELEGSALHASLIVTDIPPIPPPRRGIPVSMCQSMMEGLLSPPPPLPTRRTQSVHGQRPVSLMAPPTSSSSLAAEPDNNGFPTDMSQSFSGATTLTRQQSFGNGDTSAAENHLRQRMRLDRGHSIHSVISLKQSQADILRQEMDLPGVTVTVTLRAAMGIALVDCAEAVCIAGWNQKDFPSLHGKFHIGDQLISICNVKVMSAAMALKMLKHPPVDLVGMLVKRTPHAKVMAIRRVAEGQSIGIKRNGGTAEILYVDPNGLAASNGLPLHAPGILSGQTRTSWVLTEINSRHLNLFFKEVEIEHRLNAVGREITIVVQPSDYITELKKQLKKIKNYKNYIVQ
ncbi:hypothetical protein ACOMHN_053555 [Nucella lapillus]